MSADPRRAALDAQVLAWMREPLWDPVLAPDETRFGKLALALFAFQYEHCKPYRNFCDARDTSPANVGRWQDVPAVPAGAFKELRIASFESADSAENEKIFRTSGTSTDRRGALHLDTLELYEASLMSSLRRLLFPELESGQRTALRILAPSPVDAGDSSLSHMFGCLLDALGNEHSGFDVRDGELDLDGLRRALDRAHPVSLLGTSFAFVHLVDALEERGERFSLPPGSRAMETGGFKGRSRIVSREDLHATISHRLGVPAERIVNQYGMTELGSQFYDSVLVDPGGTRRKLGPPWVRARAIDPLSGREAPYGEPGMLQLFDLANTGSVCAIQTADLGRVIHGSPSGFEVLGRLAGAEERGCSIAADQMLGEPSA